MRTAIRQPNESVRVVQDLPHRLDIDIVLGLHEGRFELLLDDEVEERVDDALVLLLRDIGQGLADHPFVFLERRLLDPDVVVPVARDRAARDLDLPLDHFLVQFPPHFGVGIGAQFFII